ncbi:MAG: carboxypeptidase regulatory-like domain-containing protein [Candidatus Aenigmarchaeota archaeon]
MDKKDSIRNGIGLVIVSITLLSFLISFVMAQSELFGYVKNTEGSVSLQNVNITIINASTGAVVESNLTGTSGYYIFNNLPSDTYNITFKKSGYLDKEFNNYVFGGSGSLNTTLYKDGYGAYIVRVLDYENSMPIENATVNISWGTGSCPGPSCVVGSTDGNGNIIKEIPANQTGGPNYEHDFYVHAEGYSDNNSVKSSVYEGNNVSVTIYLKGLCDIYGYVEDKYRAPGFEKLSNDFIELLDQNNQTKLNFSDAHFYNTTSASNGYYKIYYPTTLEGTASCKAYVHSTKTNYKEFYELRSPGVSYLLIEMEGDSKVNGSVYDQYANIPVDDANVNLSNTTSDVVYILSTNSNGLFEAWVDGGEAHTLKVSKDGYELHINTTQYTGSMDYKRINITGKAVVYGYVADFQNEDIKLSNVSIYFDAQNNDTAYSLETDSGGYFSLNVSSALTYDLNFSKNGYYTNASFTSKVFSDSIPNNLGTVFLKGGKNVSGYVSDCESNLQLTGSKIPQVTVNLTADNGNSYEIFSNSGGYYDFWVPSTITLYNLTFEHTNYRDKVITESDGHNVCMNGEVLVIGHVVDKYAIEAKNDLENAVVSIYGPDNNKYYEKNTNSIGNFSLYVGYLTQYENYSVEINKSGFHGYNSGTISKNGGVETKNLDPVELTGKTTVNVTVYDDFNSLPINNSEVRIFLEEDGYIDYYYREFTGSDGNYLTYIKERGISPERYKVFISKDGYSAVTLGPYSVSANMTTYLYAATTVYVRDNYAKPDFEKAEMADVILYYNFTTNGTYAINETVAYLNSTCNSSYYTGLNVSMVCTDCGYSYSETNSTNTSINNGTAQFRRIYVGNYTATVNGSDVGCGVYGWDVEINSSFAGSTFTIADLNVGVTKANVMVVLYNESMGGNSPISNAVISVLNRGSVNCTTGSNGICTLNYVPSGGNVTIKAEHSYYKTNSTNYTIQAANISDYLNNLTSNPIFMTPYPGNLSVRVKNSTNDYLQDINVTVSNSTASLSGKTDSSGYANFTELTGFYNVTVNGSLEGYDIEETNNYFVGPNVTSTLEVSLDPVTLLVHVAAGGSDIENANVTLWNLTSGNVAESATNGNLTALTNSSGDVLFGRVIPGRYNLTINATGDGYNFYSEVINVTAGSNSKSVDLNDTEKPKYSNVGSDSASVAEGTDVEVYSFWTDNSGLDSAILYTNITGTWGVYGINDSLTGNESWANFTVDTTDYGGETVWWYIWANDTLGNFNETTNNTFSVTSLFTVSFETPTPTNGTKRDKNWVFVNASSTKTPDTCILNWTTVGGSSANHTMTKSGNVCYKNMTGLWNANYTYKVFVNISTGESNVSETREVEVSAKINFMIFVNDTGGNYAQRDGSSNGVQLNISNSTGYSSASETNENGNVTFSVWPGTYNLTANGTLQGYGINETFDFVVNNSDNKTTLIVNITWLRFNVTNSTGDPQGSLVVTVYESDNSTIAKNATGDNLQKSTDSNGFAVFNRVLPCSDCNMTVGTGATKTANSTRFSISAGQNLTVHIDPPSAGSGLELMTVKINVTVDGVANSDLDNITVTLSNTTDSHSNETVDGVATIHMPGGYWNVTIDGSAVGFGVAYDYDVALGKIVANSGTTNTEGYASLQIAGSVKYYLRVEKFGYRKYDDMENGTDRLGQQSIYVNLSGISTLSGTVYDKYFLGVDNETIDNAIVNFYMATDCGSLEGSNLRYGIVTDENGTYVLNVSNKQTDENASQSYCLKVTADGYEENITGTYYFEPGSTNLNITMVGDKNISGHVKDMITELPLNNTNVKVYTGEGVTRLAYTETTDGDGYFITYVSSRSKYLNYSVNFTRINYYDIGATVYPIPNYKNYYMRPGGTTLMTVNVTSNLGESLTNSSEITWNVSSTEYGIEIEKPYCVSLITNTISCWVYDNTGYLKSNATFLGYGYNNSYVENPNQTFAILLNVTVLNITTKSDSDDLLDNMTIILNGSLYQNVTKNGSALFSKILTKSYNITFSGNMTEVYFLNRTNTGTIVVTEAMSGTVNNILYVFNETSAAVNVSNETYDAISGINITIQNQSVATHQNETDANGKAFFKGIKPASNYTVVFNKTELYALGYIPVNGTINVTAGEDNDTTNNINIILEDVNLILNVTNETGNAVNANVTVYFNGSVAKNGYNASLNGSLSSGVISFTNVKPTEDYLGENYTVVIDANSTGYGIRRLSLNITLNNTENYIEKNFGAMALNVSVFNESGDNIEYNVTVSILNGGALQYNSSNDPLNETFTSNKNSTRFTHLFVIENYTVNATSVYYFNSSYDFDVGNESVSPGSVTFSLIARKLYVFVKNNSGEDLEESVNISIVNASTGAQVTGTNGSAIPDRIDIVNSTFFEYIPGGNFNISINSSMYFKPADYTFSSDNITLNNLRNVSFSLLGRSIMVILRNESSDVLEEGANVSIINKTNGSVISKLGGGFLNATGIQDNTTFTNIPDGSFYINARTDLYFTRNVSFDTSQISQGDDNVSISLYKRSVDVYLYDLLGSSVNETLTVEILNSSNDVALNLSSDYLNGTAATGSITFYGIPDEILNINASNENYTLPGVYNFSGVDYAGLEINLSLRMKGFAYFNVSVNSTDGPVESAYITVYYNDTNLTGSAYTNAQGLAMVDVNISEYSNKLNVTAYTYYGSPMYNRSGPYSLSEGEIQYVGFTFDLCGDNKKNGNESCDGSDFGGLTCGSYGYNSGSLSCNSTCNEISSSGCSNTGGGGPGGGGYSPPTISPPVTCSEDWECHDWGECGKSGSQTRSCVDLNSCGTTRNKPETTKSCTYLPDFYAEYETISINASECKYMEVKISNNGTVSLKNIAISGTADCCTITPSSTGKISPQKEGKAKVKICVGKEEKKGSKDISILISSDKIEKWFSAKIDVEMDYPEVLVGKADDLISTVEKLKNNMSTGEYAKMISDLNRVIELANKGMVDDAEKLLQDTTRVIEMGGFGKFIWPDYLTYVIISVIVTVGAGGGLFYMRKRLKTGKLIPVSIPSIPSIPSVDDIERNINMIKNKISEMGRLELDEDEMEYCKKIKSILEQIEGAVKGGKFHEIKKYVNDVELMIGTLESRLVSRGLMGDTGRFK